MNWREQLDSSSSTRWTLRIHFFRYHWQNIPATCFRWLHPRAWSNLSLHQKVLLPPQGYYREPSWVCVLISKIRSWPSSIIYWYCVICMTTVWTSSGKSETDVMNAMWLSNSRSQRLASLMLSSLAIKSRTASDAWMMIASRQWWILLCLLTLRRRKDALGLEYCLVSLYRTMQPRQPNHMTWFNQRSTETYPREKRIMSQILRILRMHLQNE